MDPSDGAETHSTCESGRHDLCAHVQGDAFIRSLMARNLEGFDASGETLCTCTCHDDCPLAGQVDGHGWPDRCTCEGTVIARRVAEGRPTPDDFATTFRNSRDRTRRRREARAAVAARAAGRTRDEVSQMIDEEWAGRGLDPPTEPIRGMELDRFMDPSYRGIKDALMTVDVATALVKAPFRLANLLRQHSQPEAGDIAGPPGVPDDRTYTVRAGKEGVPVILDTGAQSLLAGFGAGGMIAPKVIRMSDVEVRIGVDGTVEVWPAPDGRGAASDDRRRLGILHDEDAEPYRRPVLAAGRVHQAAVCRAIRTPAADGSWQLHLCVPTRS